MRRKKPLCHNQKFGHNFPFPGANCSNCGVNQHELNEKVVTWLKDIKKYKPRKAERGIHSEMHALAKEVSEFFGEPKKFAMYLGIIKNTGIQRSYQIFSEIKQSKKVKTPGKLFVFLSAYKKKDKKEQEKMKQKNNKKINKNKNENSKRAK